MRGSIRRRSKNSWEISIDLGQGAEGKRMRKFVNVKGKKADADRKLTEILANLDRGIPVDPSKLRVGDFLDKWFDSYVMNNTRPKTVEGYEVIIRLHLKPYLEHIEISKLQPFHIQDIENHLLEAGRSPRTVQHVHRVIHQALAHAMKWGLVWRNVAAVVKPPKTSNPNIRVPEQNEVLSVLVAAKETPYYAALRYMAFTGCRRGECLGLRWDDIDLDRRLASVVQTIQRINGKGIVIQPPKSGKGRRAIALDSGTVEILRLHRVQQLEQRLQLGELWVDHGLVFPGPKGKPLDPSVLTHTFKRLCKSEGISGVRLHDLRHFHATLLLKEGTHPKIVQERLGHATISITLDTYSHVIPSMQLDAANSFASAMENSETDG